MISHLFPARRHQSLFVPTLLLVLAHQELPGASDRRSGYSDNSVDATLGREQIALEPSPHLKGTTPLNPPADIFGEQYRQTNEYLSRLIAATPAARDRLWRPDFSSSSSYRKSVGVHRDNLRKMLGLVEHNAPARLSPGAVLQETGVRVEDVTIALEPDLKVHAMLFIPANGKNCPAIIAIPPADETREQFAGIADGANPPRWLTRLLDHGVVVAVPSQIERTADHPLCQKLGKNDRRLIMHRLGFVVGRTLVGLEVEQVLALRSWLADRPEVDPRRIGVMGREQGAMTALYAAAVDEELAGVAVVDYFREREGAWQEPVDRMLYGQLNEFGDAEVAALIAPRSLSVIYSVGSETPAESVQAELRRAQRFYGGLKQDAQLYVREEKRDEALDAAARRLAECMGAKHGGAGLEIGLRLPKEQVTRSRNEHFEGLHAHLRRLIDESETVREARWQLLQTAPGRRAGRVAELQADLSKLMGVIPDERLPLNLRTRLVKMTDQYVAYEVMFDALTGVEVYGHLLVPRFRPSRLPGVICQHGLNGKPDDVTAISRLPWEDPNIYHRFAARLAEDGYVVFAPYLTVPYSEVKPINWAGMTNPIVRRGALVGKMRAAIELAKLRRITDFLQSLDFVNGDRLAYYGLSYGGQSVNWMAPLEPRLKALIVSGEFNDWRAKTTNEELRTSYLFHPSEDEYFWDMLHRFSHVELTAAKWPRAICIEYGNGDTTTTPEWHERTWRKVREWSEAWGEEERVIRDRFEGKHEIHGVGGTFEFLNRWLRPERSAGRDYRYSVWPMRRELPGLSKPPEEMLPYATHRLAAGDGTAVRGRFYVSTVSPVFTGLAVRVSRAGKPSDIVIRFGTSEGASDIGESRIAAATVLPLYDLWYMARTKPIRLDPGRQCFFEIKTEGSADMENHYVVYGPKPLGGRAFPPYFELSFRVLTEKEPLPEMENERYEFTRENRSEAEWATLLKATAGRAQPSWSK